MSYTLWSHGRLVGHTDLDLPHVQDRVRMGFIEPAPSGAQALVDATCVPGAIVALKRVAAHAGREAVEALAAEADVHAAFDRREALHLELRDATGRTIPVRWMEVNDLHEDLLDDDLDVDLPTDAGFEAGDRDEDDDATACDALMDLESEFSNLVAAQDGEPGAAPDLLADGPIGVLGRPWSPPDERWETMRYHVMVYLHSPGDLP